MPQWPRHLHRWILLSFAMVALMLVSACTDDLYASCTLDSDDPYLQHCLKSSDESKPSCVVGNQLQCETRICGKYQGSPAFCTIECNTDEDCPNGACKEFVMTTGVKHCVEKPNLGK